MPIKTKKVHRYKLKGLNAENKTKKVCYTKGEIIKICENDKFTEFKDTLFTNEYLKELSKKQ